MKTIQPIYKNIIATIVAIIIALVSIFAVAPLTKSYKFHSNSIQALDDKKVTVTELTVAAVGVSTALAAIPGDATTPLSNQIMDLSSYLLIVIGVIFLEKILLTLTGYVSFTFLIPIACLLYCIYIYAKKDILKKLSIKLFTFGIIIFLVVPISVQTSNLIENTYNETIENAKNTEITSNDKTNTDTNDNSEENGFLSKFKNSISNLGENVSELVNKGEKELSKFIDAIAVLLITSCVIPIIVLIFLVWIVKIIFGVKISVPDISKNKKIEDKEKISQNTWLKPHSKWYDEEKTIKEAYVQWK